MFKPAKKKKREYLKQKEIKTIFLNKTEMMQI